MNTNNFLYRREYDISDSIRIIIPTVGEILNDEDGYYNAVQFLTAQPIDFMVQLDDAGVDFTQINEWDLFLLLFPALSQMDTHLIFDDLDLSKFVKATNEENGQVMLVDRESDAKIDRTILAQIASVLRKIHHLEINRKKPANEEAKAFMLERARAKAKRRRNRKRDSDLESLIVAMVNTEQYKYDFGGTLQLSIYQFNESVRQIIKKIDYDNRMRGVYAGTINPKELSQDDLNWLVHK